VKQCPIWSLLNFDEVHSHSPNLVRPLFRDRNSSQTLSEWKCKTRIALERTTYQLQLYVTHLLILCLYSRTKILFWFIYKVKSALCCHVCPSVFLGPEHLDRLIYNLHGRTSLNGSGQFQRWYFLLIFSVAFTDPLFNKVTQDLSSFYRFTSENLRHKIKICLICIYSPEYFPSWS
jgi:hypothetical protein